MTVQTSKVHTIFFTVCWSSSSLFVLFLWVQRIYSCLPDVIHDGILAKEKRHAQSSFPTFYMAYIVWLFHPITSQDKIFQQTRPSTHPPVHSSIFYHLFGVGSPGSSLGFPLPSHSSDGPKASQPTARDHRWWSECRSTDKSSRQTNTESTSQKMLNTDLPFSPSCLLSWTMPHDT